MKNPHDIIVQPHITEKSMALSYGDARIKIETDIVRKYTFIVAKTANKIEIKAALEAIYNSGRKAEDMIKVESVRTIKVLGKYRSKGFKKPGYEADRKKAVITLAKGQTLEDYGI